MSIPKIKDCMTIYHYHHTDVTWKNCKSAWLECDDKQERRVIIGEAINIARKVVDKENVEEELRKKIRVYEIQDYLEYEEGLVVPPLKPHLLYGQKKLSNFPPIYKVTGRIDCATSVKFCSLEFDDQVKYMKNYFDLWLEFDKKLKKWRKSERDFFDETLDKIAFSFKKESVINYKIPTKMKRKNFSEVYMPYARQTFPDEPGHFSLTTASLMEAILRDDQKKINSDEIEKILENIHFIARKGIESQVVAYRSEYRTALLVYVAELTEDKRKVFLGFRRKPIYMKMMEDVFNTHYPSDKYPVFVMDSNATLKSEKKRMERRKSKGKTDLNSSKEFLTLPEDFDTIQVIYDSLDSLKTWGYNMDSSDSD